MLQIKAQFAIDRISINIALRWFINCRIVFSKWGEEMHTVPGKMKYLVKTQIRFFTHREKKMIKNPRSYYLNKHIVYFLILFLDFAG